MASSHGWPLEQGLLWIRSRPRWHYPHGWECCQALHWQNHPEKKDTATEVSFGFKSVVQSAPTLDR